MNTKHIIQYFATMATMGESREKLVSVRLSQLESKVLPSNDRGDSALTT